MSALIILIGATWLVFFTTAITAFYYSKHQNSEVLGITFSSGHASSPEVGSIVRGFRKNTVLLCALFFLASFSLFIKPVQNYGELLLMSLILCNLCLTALLMRKATRKLENLKTARDWKYPESPGITIDLAALIEKEKGGVSPLWIWLFFGVSFIPSLLVYSLLGAGDIETWTRILVAAVFPVLQLSAIAVFYSEKRKRIAPISSDSTINQAHARCRRKLGTETTSLMALVMLFFDFVFAYGLITDGVLAILGATVFMVIALIALVFWQQKRISTLDKRWQEKNLEVEGEILKEVHEKQNVWKWGGLYYNPGDRRLFVPKREPSIGITVNFGRPLGKVLGFFFILLPLLIVIPLLICAQLDYSFRIEENTLTIAAPPYSYTLAKENLASIKTLQALPQGMRTNGVGGIKKSYGYFSLAGYGKCRLYVYNDVPLFIVVELKDSGAGYVILNDKTLAATEALQEAIEQLRSDVK